MHPDLQLLVMLVHKGLLDEGSARQAMAQRDAGAWLVAQGKCTAGPWQEWQCWRSRLWCFAFCAASENGT